ncbi:cysteine-rich secretory protein LCCL domain-containing 2 [Anolis sagrei]|uniref:cysteine-rich secretory protein LCCL domain-containing 2 n=1 Tax=Anolis sagrei TaxID=38937 RepID=UPI0035211AD1
MMSRNPSPAWTVMLFFGLLFVAHGAQAFFLPNATHLESLLSKYREEQPHLRSRRAISPSDKDEILALHNKLRGQAYPSASNMEYMIWDDELERSAESWAHQCIWDHGPQSLLPSIGQNLGVHWGRFRPPSFHVQSWYDEVKDYTYPYPHECNPWCPERCTGPMCTHYTQIVWATTNKVGCAVHVCPRMDVWGQLWENAVYLVCNYSPKIPAQVIKCDTKMRDKCKGSTCNRYLCPAGCLNSRAKVFGTFSYESSSSICRAAIHSGVLDNRGGLVDITRKGRSDFFVKSTRNGIDSISKFKPSNAFVVSKVTVQTLDCYTTVEELCPFKKPATHCPRSYCPAYCKDEPSYWAPVYGTNVYADSSSICKTAVHAGVLKENEGGYVDVMPVDKKKSYSGSLKNGIRSESLKTLREGKAFRIFAVKQ